MSELGCCAIEKNTVGNYDTLDYSVGGNGGDVKYTQIKNIKLQ
jgi:hypothetical protein